MCTLQSENKPYKVGTEKPETPEVVTYLFSSIVAEVGSALAGVDRTEVQRTALGRALHL